MGEWSKQKSRKHHRQDTPFTRKRCKDEMTIFQESFEIQPQGISENYSVVVLTCIGIYHSFKKKLTRGHLWSSQQDYSGISLRAGPDV
jgi:hypothetical protein